MFRFSIIHYYFSYFVFQRYINYLECFVVTCALLLIIGSNFTVNTILYSGFWSVDYVTRGLRVRSENETKFRNQFNIGTITYIHT